MTAKSLNEFIKKFAEFIGLLVIIIVPFICYESIWTALWATGMCGLLLVVSILSSREEEY